MSKRYYEVTFAPHDTITYTYNVAVDDSNDDVNDGVKAELEAWDRFRYDIGYDYSKDFDVVSIQEESDD